MDGYKHSILDEEEKNEKQTMLLNRIENDIVNTKKIIEQTKIKRQELQQKQASYRFLIFTLFVFIFKHFFQFM